MSSTLKMNVNLEHNIPYFQVWGSDTELRPLVDMRNISDNYIYLILHWNSVSPKKYHLKGELSFIIMTLHVCFQVLFFSIGVSMRFLW